MIATLISLVALVVAAFSFFVASERFRLDLYNKRFDIYMRTVKFYQALLSSKEAEEATSFAALRADFIIASRESQFLFGPESGVYDLLSRLNKASFTITGLHDMPKGLPPEQILANQKQFSNALMLWNSSTNIYPREIEEVLYQHPKVLEAAAVGVPDPRLGERVCACIVSRPGESLSFEELIAFLKDKIATYKLPEFLRLLDALPRTPTGKVQKGPLRDIVLERMRPE
jgi:hypothetical protein